MRKPKLVWGVAGMATLASLFAVQLAVGAGIAGAQAPAGGRIRPHQVFGALVNGKNGVSSPVEIQMACAGPIKKGETGHPVAGQTVTVFQPEAIAGHFGNTGGHGREIGAFFGAPPPASGATSRPAVSSAPVTSSGPVIFRYYGTKKIPTSEVLPCSGSGHVIFVPLPVTPAKDVVVPVTYVGQP
jgi:hypothetical protein